MARLHVGESITMAMGSLWGNKLRTFLTLLGIIIGVLTIIAVVSIIQGLNNYVYTKMAFFGANDFSIAKFSFIGTSLSDYREQMKRKNLTLDDMYLIRRQCPSCELVGASTSTSKTTKYRSQFLKSVEIRGVTHVDHLIGSVMELEQGRNFRQEDDEHSRYVCIIGSDIKDELFLGLNPLGKRLKVGRHNFVIIGVAEPKGKLLDSARTTLFASPLQPS